jgi:hypothetical protein
MVHYLFPKNRTSPWTKPGIVVMQKAMMMSAQWWVLSLVSAESKGSLVPN